MRTVNAKDSDFLTKLARFVEADGARNWNQISRELSIPYVTLRDRMLSLKENGMTVLTIPDVEKIGLERVRGTFRLSREHLKDIKSLFGGLHQSAGLRSYARLLLNHVFECDFLIPKGTAYELSNLFAKLEALNYIEDANVSNLLWKDFLVLKTEFYDYSKKEWDVDFSNLSVDPSSFQVPQKSEVERFDYNDLLMIKEIEMNPWIKTVEIANKIGLQVGDATYHLNKHVLGGTSSSRKLIKAFRLRWDGTREAWLKHSIILGFVKFKEISDDELKHAIGVLSASPFTWSHMRTEDGSYMAELVFPISQFPETMNYISSKLLQVGLVPEFYMKDWSCVSSFTIPYLLYNKERSSWNFNADLALEYTLQMVKTYSA
jgi:hypothetical protein